MSETTMTDLAELGAATAEDLFWQNQKLTHWPPIRDRSP